MNFQQEKEKDWHGLEKVLLATTGIGSHWSNVLDVLHHTGVHLYWAIFWFCYNAQFWVFGNFQNQGTPSTGFSKKYQSKMTIVVQVFELWSNPIA
jgi:hypothetical protein